MRKSLALLLLALGALAYMHSDANAASKLKIGILPHGNLPIVFTVEDMTAARDSALAADPPLTDYADCWSALIVQKEKIPTLGPKNTGVAFVVEKYLEYQKFGSQPLFPPEVIKSCAIMTYDLRIDFVRLAGLVGISAVNPIHLPF
jgi:hypothetical protein